VSEQIFVAGRETEDALRDERLKLVLDEKRAARVAKAGGERFGQPDGLVRLAQ